jgi:hypothetical protein
LKVPNVPTALPAIHGFLAATARARRLILIIRNLAELARGDVRVVIPSIGPATAVIHSQPGPADGERWADPSDGA